MRRIICIGNGIAGITAARHIRKRSNDAITVISAETEHFFSRTALMYIYMGHMRYRDTKPYEDHFWRKNRIELLRARITRVDTAEKRLHTEGGEQLAYDVLIIASGSKSNRFGWPGQDLDGVQGLYSLPDLELLEKNSVGLRQAVIIGGGLIGIELAEMLHSRNIGVTLLVREPRWMSHAYPREESEMIARQVRRSGIDLRLSTELEQIEGDGAGRVRSVITKGGDELPCQLVGLTVGVSPNIDFLKDSAIELDRGVLVDEKLQTSAPDVYAIGDCAQLRQPRPGRRPVEPLWYTGRIMGQTVAQTICGESRSYDPGIWFNSAKFLELEWQVYGSVSPDPPEGVESLYWQHAGGEKAIRLEFRSSDGVLTGLQVLGIRYRHQLCHEWLRDERTIEYVLENLGAANFDPEFYAQHEAEVVACYNQRFPDRQTATLKRRRGLPSLFAARSAAHAGS